MGSSGFDLLNLFDVRSVDRSFRAGSKENQAVRFQVLRLLLGNRLYSPSNGRLEVQNCRHQELP